MPDATARHDELLTELEAKLRGLYPFSSPHAGRSGRPSRFTIRELLILVALVRRRDRASYLRDVFGWYHERTRALRAAIPLAIGAILTAANLWREQVNGILAIVLAALVVLGLLYFVLGRVQLSPLHREYECCLALLANLERYRAQIRVAVREDGQRIPAKHVTWRAWPDRTGAKLGDKLEQAHVRFELDQKLAAAADRRQRDLIVGRYLFSVLGPVPTDDYERRPEIQALVDGYLRRATMKG